jgi:hypothetical protein
MTAEDRRWPALPFEAWEPTRATLHMWTQIVGKIRLALSARVNHFWQTPLYVSARGLTTSLIPCESGSFEILFDFIEHVLLIQKSDGTARRLALAPRSVADFYAEIMALLRAMGIKVKIWPVPVELDDPIPFEQDRIHAAYDPGYVGRFWQILLSVDAIFKEFRGEFIGKCSPVHFFWGSFDLAVTRFSGRRAPLGPDADLITREAYSHEVSSVGWWPGDGSTKYPAFFAYAAPEPPGYPGWAVRPKPAFYDQGASQFRLRYDDLRQSPSPRQDLLEFCRSTYEGAAVLGKWDRAELERKA